ncbi:hypothetical protein C8Q79DRAFT_894682, partial [Trametes meyenii]
MATAAKKYGLRCEARNPARSLRENMPVWYHVGTRPGNSTANSVASKCLRERHGVNTTAQCELVAERLRESGHKNSPKCPCRACDADRRVRGCENPHRCATAARKAIKRLWMKWRPEARTNDDGLTLTRERRCQNKVAREEKGRIVFDPTITQAAPLAMAFRIFVGNEQHETKAALRPQSGIQVEQEEVEVYTDGACERNGEQDAAAGSGIWFADSDQRNKGERLPYEHQSNQAAEVYAVAMACREVPPFAPMHVVSD